VHHVIARVACAALLTASLAAVAAPVDDLLQEYRAQGGKEFSAAAGEKLWHQNFKDAKSGEDRRCDVCHTRDLRATGKHAVTGKAIKPLAPSVNPERLADKSKIEKWLERNCKWTLGRSCTPQEKGDVLSFLRNQ
jgi:Domain of unknown function (DUF1924)